MVFSQDRVLRSALVSRSFTLQFAVVELLEVYKVLPKTEFFEADCGADR